MTERIAIMVSQRLLLYQLIQKEEQEWYQYCIQVRLERMLACLLIGLCAAFFHVLPETVLFLLSFFMIRRHAGGFHANSFAGCMIISAGVYLCYVMALYPFLLRHPVMNDGILLCSAIVILVVGAVNHPNMAWNEREYHRSKWYARMALLLDLLIFAGMRLIRIPESYCLFMSFGVILSAVFLVLGKIIKQEVK